MGTSVTNIGSATTNYIDPKNRFDLKTYRDIFYHCYSNNLPCIISSSVTNVTDPGIHYITNKKNVHFSWDYY